MDEETQVDIYTDGACSGNPGPGGWAALLCWRGQERSISGFVADTTNNRMELTAVIEALRSLKRSARVRLYTDSTYVKDGVTRWLEGWKRRGWKTADKQPVKNRDLWEALDQARAPHTIDFFWVRGHDGHTQNERVDALARAAITAHVSG